MLITKEIIDSLKVGDVLPNMFGNMKAVTRIDKKGVNKCGQHYAKFMQEFGDKFKCELSGEIIEGEKII